ncbi:phosphopantetheine-binding protein, partial [Streptomyces palmae]|uniref:phosphopantetheine-binding protein n=1 Tax=Streptomyces palmae TaxID=1701085 RepID=UPI0035ED055D
MTSQLGDADRARMSRAGLAPMTAEQGLALLDGALRHGAAGMFAARLELTRLAAQPPGALPPLLRALTAQARGGAGRRPAVAQATDLPARLASLAPAERDELLLGLVRGHAATVLGHADPESVRPDAPFKDLGFDSLTAVELRNRLGMATGLRLPAALVFRFPTPAAIAEHLREELCPAEEDTALPVLRELERLEAAMARFSPEGEAGAQLAKRLETLLWRLGDRTAEVDHAMDGEALESASDDEVFALIDEQ